MLRFLISKQTKKQLQSVSNFGKIKSVDRQPACRNGRRGGLKIHWWHHRAGSSPAAGRFENPRKYWIFPLFSRVFGVLEVKRVNVKTGFLKVLCNTNATRKKDYFYITSHILDMSVSSYPIGRNHPALRIKRIRLSVNLADRIMPEGVTAQQIPPAAVL